MTGKPKHPSGKPVRQIAAKPLSMYRQPLEGPITPRLQIPPKAFEMGFHSAFRPLPDDDESE